jgi:hypothetical protein
MTSDSSANIRNLKSTLRKAEFALRREPDDIVDTIKKMGIAFARDLLEKRNAREIIPHIPELFESLNDTSRLERLEKRMNALRDEHFTTLTTLFQYISVITHAPTIAANPELFLSGCTIVVNYLTIKADRDERLTCQQCEGAISSLLSLEQYLTDQREDVAAEIVRGGRYKVLQSLLATLRSELNRLESTISSVVTPETIQTVVESLFRIRHASRSLEKLALSLTRWKDEMITFSLCEISDRIFNSFFNL